MPTIASITSFEEHWVQWWSAAQPEWRDTERWPFLQDGTAGDWGRLSSGGKDGLFLVVVSLGWWVHARDPAADCKLDAAISDVSWVLEQLITSLSADAIASDSSPDTPVTSSRLRRPCTVSRRAERPKKRARV